MEKNSYWKKAGCGYEGGEERIRLYGWSCSRRVIILRRRIANKDIGVLKKQGLPHQLKQLTFDFSQTDNETIAYEYAVLVTNLEDEIITLTQHGRQKLLTITSLHAKIEKVTKILTVISSFFKPLQQTAEQLKPGGILKRIIEVAFRKFFKTGNKSPPKALHVLS